MNPPIPSDSQMPKGVFAAALIVILFMSLFVLEITDSIVFHREVARSAFAFPIAAVLLWGFLRRHRWAWFAMRGITFVGTLWFAAVAGYAWLHPHIPARDRQGIMVISVILSLILLAGFVTLGRPKARSYYHI